MQDFTICALWIAAATSGLFIILTGCAVAAIIAIAKHIDNEFEKKKYDMSNNDYKPNDGSIRSIEDQWLDAQRSLPTAMCAWLQSADSSMLQWAIAAELDREKASNPEAIGIQIGVPTSVVLSEILPMLEQRIVVYDYDSKSFKLAI